jgi:hypothetical protein
VRLRQVLQSGQTGNVHNLAGSRSNYHSPPYRARGPHPFATLTSHLDPARSRLLAPTKSSAAHAINRDPDELDFEGSKAKLPFGSVSPKKEPITAKFSESSKPIFTSAVASRMRQGLKSTSRTLPQPTELPQT